MRVAGRQLRSRTHAAGAQGGRRPHLHGAVFRLADRRGLAGAPDRAGRAPSRRLLPRQPAVSHRAGAVRIAGRGAEDGLRRGGDVAATARLCQLGGRRHGRQPQRGCRHHRRQPGHPARACDRALPCRRGGAGASAQPDREPRRGVRAASAAAGRLPRALPAGGGEDPSAPRGHALSLPADPDRRAAGGQPGRRACRGLLLHAGAARRPAADRRQPGRTPWPARRCLRRAATDPPRPHLRPASGATGRAPGLARA